MKKARLLFSSTDARAAAVLLAVVVVPMIVGASKRSPTPPPADDLPAPRRDEGYVASDACVECHADAHGSWRASYHRSMTQVATPEAVLGDFDGSVINSDGAAYRVFERDGEFWAEMPDPDRVMDVVQMQGKQSEIANIPSVERRVVMTTGSHHYQTYWVAGDDRYGRLLQTLPLVYLPGEGDQPGRWIPRENAFMRPPGDRMLTQWNHHCIKCHSTGGVPGLTDDGQRGRFETRVAELGIACEACHGPGEDHVAMHREAASDETLANAARSEGEGDPTIVNPARLDNDRSSQVCGQCHGVFVAANAAHGLAYARLGESYRPGGDLHLSRYYIQHPANGRNAVRSQELRQNPEFFRERWWDDGSILAGGREYNAMSTSACFLKGDMSCLSCHAMHDSDPADQLIRGLSDNAMCTQCHGDAQYTTDVAQHTHHGATSSGSDCLNCHMPRNSYALFSAIRSHQMGSPSVAASIEHNTPNACNLCHLDRTLAWAQDHTAEWYGHESVATSVEQREVAAGVLWMLKGDAAQRAIAVWNAGWGPAREASGDAWIGLYASRLLSDPYSVVRRIAHKTLLLDGHAADAAYDFVAPDGQLAEDAAAAMARWTARRLAETPANPALLFSERGRLDRTRFDALFAERNDRPVTIKE